MTDDLGRVRHPESSSDSPRWTWGPRRGLRRTLLLAASLTLLVLWGRGAAPFLAWELARDHGRCFAKGQLPAKIWTSEPTEATAWFEAQGTPFPVIPSGAGGLELVGGRYCSLGDRLAAHLYYSGDQHHLSLYVISGPARFADSVEVMSGGKTVRLLRTAGTTVALVAERAEDVEAFQNTFTTSIAQGARKEPDPAHY
ncbi:MAG TPA: hypothetical protein VN461_05690 [Vicinamibacteria bacterium]|jgi:hypothetical protein|nr:hypothetical protein [Vicinamibacteria bacterium]